MRPAERTILCLSLGIACVLGFVAHLIVLGYLSAAVWAGLCLGWTFVWWCLTPRRSVEREPPNPEDASRRDDHDGYRPLADEDWEPHSASFA